MTTFDDRERAYEKKFQVDEEMKFRIDCLAARLLGQWAATRFGLDEKEATAYVEQALEAEIRQAAHSSLLIKLEQDFKTRDMVMPRNVLERELAACQDEARKKLSEPAG